MISVRLLVLALLLLVSGCAGQECFTRQTTDPGVDTRVPCVFPFKYKGKTYNKCTTTDMESGLDWCSTKVDGQGDHLSGQGDWGVCGPECPRELLCPQTWSLTQSGCYKVLEDSQGGLTKEAARAGCEERGGYLADITSRQELEHLMAWYSNSGQSDKMYQAEALWLGITNDTERNIWVSDRTGEPVLYNNWLDTEPTHENDNERCAGIFVDRNFNNDFHLKPFGWFAMNCGHAGFDFYKKWRVNSQALCERDVLETLAEPGSVEVEERVVGPEGCYENWTVLPTGCYLFQRLPSTYREARDHCRTQGGHLAEITDQQEFQALEAAWRLTVPEDESKDWRSYWLGLTDIQQEGVWLAETSGQRQNFTVWNGEEPNNYGGKVPGEDCAIAHLWAKHFKWYDAPCDIRGFPMQLGNGFTLNPLCEHKPFATEVPEIRVDGADQDWVRINGKQYKFIKVSYGVTKFEAEEICRENGGRLAEIKGEQTRLALKNYYKNSVLADQSKTSFFLAALNLFRSSPEAVKYAWWIGASDAEEEGQWRWSSNNQNLTYSAWYFWGGDKETTAQDGSDNPTVLEFGDHDCAAILDTDMLLQMKDWGEEREKYRPRVEAEDTFKWVTASCYSRTYLDDEDAGFRLTPLCQKV